MFIDQRAQMFARFGRADQDWVLLLKLSSARPNRAGGLKPVVYKHVTPTGVDLRQVSQATLCQGFAVPTDQHQASPW